MNPTVSVLVIEDNEDQQIIFRAFAQRLKMSANIVKRCTDGLAAAQSETFDIILLDCKMPDMSGAECAQRIREIDRTYGRHTPIIAVTARALPGDREKCLDAGMDDYLSKPFTVDQLEQKIHEWVSSKHLPC
jgi:CheY-like chemotaxis protein